MANSSTRGWAFGTILLCGIIGAAGYMLVIKPNLDEVADLEESYEAAREYNDLLDNQILAAKATAKEAPEWRGILNAIEIDLPPLANQPELHRLLVRGLETRGLPVISIQYGAPTLLNAPAVDEASTATTDPDANTGTDGSAEGTSGEAGTSEGEGAATGGDGAVGNGVPQSEQTQAAFARLVGVPVSITTQGPPHAVLQWFRNLQVQDERFLTVVSFQISGAQQMDREGIPPVQPGDWQISVNAMVFSLLDADKSFPIEEPGQNPPYTPGSPTVPIQSDVVPTS